MGIRFLCPNGHKLNVKAFLAGKRGICPQCDAKFLVPAASGGQAPAIDEASELSETGLSETGLPATELPGSTSVEPELAAPPPPPPTPVAASPPSSVGADLKPTEAWYVRTATGEQFGPASLEIMQSWVDEGRVAADCWVWRTGWPEWQAGEQALALLNGSPPAIAIPPVLPAEVTSEGSPSLLPDPASPTASYRSTKRSRQDRARKVTFFLGAVVLLLLVVLVAVLVKNN